MSRVKVFTPLMVALVFALFGGGIAYKWAQAQKTKNQTVPSAGVLSVAVAAADIPWGTKLSPEYLRMEIFLLKSVPEGHFPTVEALASRVSVLPLKKGDIILESRLAPTSITTGGVTAIITPGRRAIAVKGDKIIGLAGLIKPHDRVDVLVTLENGDGRQQTTKIVLENIPVLATGGQIQKNEKGDTLPVDVYTLEVTPEEGEKLALAANQGKLQFALRSIVDTDIVLTSGATISDTLDSYARSSGKPEEKPIVMEIIRGKEREVVRF